jgi:lipoprotein-releasing system permease protein
MYIPLLCWRYLRTRYIALASIISVMLGVATMIVVNAVMAGFSEKMKERLHGILSDVVVEGTSFDGFDHAPEVMALIRQIGGERVHALAPTIETVGILSYRFGPETYTRPVQIIGIEPSSFAKTGEFAQYLVDDAMPSQPIAPTFDVKPEILERSEAAQFRRELGIPKTAAEREFDEALRRRAINEVRDHGAILGYALATHHQPGTPHDMFLAPVGTQIALTFASTADVGAIEPRRDTFTTIGFFKSGMSEYDSSFVYVPLERLQEMRGMRSGPFGGRINTVQIRVRAGTDLDRLAADLAGALWDRWPNRFRVQTWEQKQGPLLAAVALEQSILNILLFFIIAVAGFGILAIFSMIVVEKTRDIGVLKALGASTRGVRSIFLGYGLSLGLVGSGVGMAGGLLFVAKINAIEKWLSGVLGHKVFDDTIYYFNEIPTQVDPMTVAWIVVGALLIAVGASVWPAQRAASLHPVRALRYE